MKIAIIISSLCILLNIAAYSQKTVRYDLFVKDTMVSYTGKNVKAIAINGHIPAPTLYFTEGDTALIYVHNTMHHETSVHWHGLLLPNEHDGVPYLTTAPIKPMSTHIFTFPIRQNGTYWYHSHTMLQEQIGMYGAFIIHKENQKKENEEVVLLSDWSDENPDEIERSLHNATDWYSIKKGATQSYWDALQEGYLGTKLENEWKRMHAMDVSDVFYERFLVNGHTDIYKKQYKPGDTIRLRVINGSASTYFWLNYNGGKITVIATDGMDVEPVDVDRLIIGTSETYDIQIVLPEDSSMTALIATSEDRMGAARVWLGSGAKRNAEQLPLLKYFEGMQMMNDMMTVGGELDDMGMEMSLQEMDMNSVMYPELDEIDESVESDDTTEIHHHEADSENEIVTLNYAMLRSITPTTLPNAITRTLYFELTGNMNRYVWTINNKTISESDKILIKKGENIRIILTNKSMMRHPMHLHGHFFRVVNGNDEYSPLKTVLDIMPMETDTIEFNASADYGDWYFHCHILYHMMSGMGKIFHYENSPPNPQIPNPVEALQEVYHDDRRFYPSAEIGLESNGSDGHITLANTRWSLQSEWRLGLNSSTGFEHESHISRFIDNNQFLSLYAGWDWRYRSSDESENNIFGQTSTKDARGVVCVGAQYILPWFLLSDFRIDHTGNVRLQISRDDIPVSSRIRLWGLYNTDNEFSTGIRYIVTKYISVSSHYDSDMGFGAGLVITY